MAQQDFQSRLGRLREKEEAVAPRIKQPRSLELLENMRYPLSFVWAFLLGILSVLVSRYISMVMLGVPNPDADFSTQMIIDGVVAGALIFVVRSALRIKDKDLLAAQTLGLWFTIIGMHNLVHLMPDLWAIVYGMEWVEMTLDTTEPKSLRIGATVIPLH